MSRIQKVKRNIVFSYLSQIVTALAALGCRTVFIRELNAAYLGLNGLFTNILGLLSLAELGFGIAMNYEMYKPVAEGNTEKVKALLRLYKRVYHTVAVFILVGGLGVTPFIPILVKDPGNIGNIYVYYTIYVVNTTISYYASYLLCLSNAEQDEYISSLFTMGHSLLANIFEIIVLYLYKSFYLYLIVWLVASVIQQITIQIYFNKKYQYILCAKDQPIDNETTNHIRKNMGGLIISKLSEVLLLQTDNIIIALGMNIVTVGYADNYYLITNYVKKIILSLLKSVVPSLGNLVALESREKGYEIFRVYDFIDYFIYAVVTICLVVLIQPFMSLWAGTEKVIDFRAVLLLCFSFYLAGRSQGFMNYKTACGVFYDIKITSVVTVILNIVISIVGVFKVGLIGVYIGTCVSRLYQNIRVLSLSYNKITGESFIKYLGKRVFQTVIICVPILLLNYVSPVLSPYKNWMRLFLFTILAVAISVVWILIFYWSSYEMKYIRNIVSIEIKKIKNRFKRGTL